MNIRFEVLQSVCRHQGWIQDGTKMCSFKDKHPAKCWADWQQCTKQNCPLGYARAAADIEGQMTLEELWQA